MTETDVLEKRVRACVRPEDIFPCLTVPGKMLAWMGTGVGADLRPSGIYRVLVTGKEPLAGNPSPWSC